ncbi:hypothetical protein [Desertihabitans aurantiacus]|uniref:hypothetical protein n=1 Tax=Desertihabitans aurantiacus TaxID=2282477 RepID=UPI0013002E67|nr:hypothetical protein [Desertihabitans aurantiacus]
MERVSWWLWLVISVGWIVVVVSRGLQWRADQPLALVDWGLPLLLALGSTTTFVFAERARRDARRRRRVARRYAVQDSRPER